MIDSFVTFLPSLNVLVLFSALNIARFENQRWIRARKAGMRGSNALGGFLVDLIGFSSMIFYYLFLFSFADENGLWSVVLLFIIVSIAGLLASIIFWFNIRW